MAHATNSTKPTEPINNQSVRRLRSMNRSLSSVTVNDLSLCVDGNAS